MNFEEGNYFEAYRSVFDNTGFHFRNKTNQLTHELFAKGCFIIPLDYSYDRSSMFHIRESVSGQLNIEILLKEPLKKALTLIHCAMVDGVIDINQTRVVTNMSV